MNIIKYLIHTHEGEIIKGRGIFCKRKDDEDTKEFKKGIDIAKCLTCGEYFIKKGIYDHT